MKNSKTSISRSLALATAAFVSMPAVGQAATICERLGKRAIPNGARVKRINPLGLREQRILTASVWNPNPAAAPVRVAVRVEDVELGVRVACEEMTLKGGQGGSFDIKREFEAPSTLGARMVFLPEVGDEVFSKKRPAPKILGTLVIRNVVTPTESITEFK